MLLIRFGIAALAVLSLPVSAQVRGTLSADDDRQRDKHTDVYTFEAPFGAEVSVSLTSDDFDSVLTVRHADGLESNDDCSDGATNSCVEYESPGGTHTLHVQAFDSSLGDYRVDVRVDGRRVRPEPGRVEPPRVVTAQRETRVVNGKERIVYVLDLRAGDSVAIESRGYDETADGSSVFFVHTARVPEWEPDRSTADPLAFAYNHYFRVTEDEEYLVVLGPNLSAGRASRYASAQSFAIRVNGQTVVRL